MRRAIITSAATVSGVVLLLSLKPHAQAANAGTPISTGGSGGTTSTTGSSGGTSSGSTRTIAGNTADTRYGPLQVQITVKGKKISDISVLQYPSGDPRSQQINAYALPVLNQEALSAQSARIDAVSGASYTSDGYTRSLQSALDKAGL